MDQLLNEIVKRIGRSNRIIIIGISGHGASGKTTFAKKLVKVLGQENVNDLNTDPYIISSSIRKNTIIKYEYQKQLHRFKMTACHPEAHHLFSLERDIKMLRKGLDLYSLETPYTKGILLSSTKKVLVVEGMSVAFCKPDLFDLKIYLHTDGETELSRRGIRDVMERGTDYEYLKQSHQERRIQYKVFMHPYHENFDIVIKNTNENYSIEKYHFPS